MNTKAELKQTITGVNYILQYIHKWTDLILMLYSEGYTSW